MLITCLLQKDQIFEWDDNCETSFQALKRRLTTAPILTILDNSSGLVVHSNASLNGLGYVFMQYSKVVAYEYRQLKPY